MLTSLFSLFYVTCEFHRFLHRGRAKCSAAILGLLNEVEHDIYILLDVLLCSIAEYFYELCRILASP